MLQKTLFASLMIVGIVSAGCRDTETDGTGAAPQGGNGTGGSADGGGSEGGGAEGGGVAGCEGPEATVEGIATGQFGPGSKVSVNGVIAMSHKFLVSKSSSTDNCLWGVFVSAPGLTETEENSGLIVLSYGFKAEIDEGGTMAYCPKLGQEPAGDQIPDDVRPGDVLDVIGTVARFPEEPNCTGDNPPNQVGMLQLGSACKAERVGTDTPPEPHVLTPAEITSISSTTDQAFHDKWGAVKVRMENVTVEPEAGEVVGEFGKIHFTNGVEVGDKIYYRPYSDNKCHEGPVFSDPDVTFLSVQGFHYLDFCNWSIAANDKCADFDPQSEDCTAATCEPDFLQ